MFTLDGGLGAPTEAREIMRAPLRAVEEGMREHVLVS